MLAAYEHVWLFPSPLLPRSIEAHRALLVKLPSLATSDCFT